MEQFLIAIGERAGNIFNLVSNPATQLLVLPLLGLIFICATPRQNLRLIRFWAVFFSGLTLLVAILMLTGVPVWLQSNPLFAQFVPFRPNNPEMGFWFSQDIVWLAIQIGETQSFSAHYAVGIDGLSMPLVLLCAGVVFLAIIWALPRQERIRDFLALTMLMEIGLLGVFIALDYVLFYLFWELMLIPMYFLIAGWGKRPEHAARAAMKFFIYTMLGGVFMLIAFIALQVLSAGSGGYSFSIPDLTTYSLTQGVQVIPLAWRALIFVGLLFAFAIKVPMFPFHTWLPDAHTEAPTEMSVILAAVMLKTGTYAYLRILYPTFPDVAYTLGPIIALCAVIGIVYGAAVTLVQTDLKRLVAYSSISHMGFIVLGIAAMNADATVGAVFQMVAHGVVISALFFLTGVVERRYGTRDLRELSGMLKGAPSYAVVLGLAAFAGMGLPGLIGFWGEFMVLKGTYFNSPRWTTVLVGPMDGSRYLQIVAILAVLGILTAAVYMINMLQRVLPGEMPAKATDEPGAPAPKPWRGFRLTEGLALVPLAAAMVIFGLYPAPIVNSCLEYANQLWTTYLMY